MESSLGRLLMIFSGAFGGLLATGFTKIPQWGIIHTWRNIFFFEGLISVIIGVVAFLILPSSPATASFLTPEEREAASKRITEDMKTQNVERFDMRYVKRAVLSWNTVFLSIASLCSLLTMNSMALFIPSILNSMGYSGIDSQLLSVPPYAWATIVCVTVTIMSDRTRKRGAWILGVMPFTALGFIILLVPTHVGVHYFALFLCLTGAFTASPMLVAWCVDNSAGHMTRAIAAGTVVGFGNIGGLIAAWTYLLPDAPRYIKGHALNLGFAGLCLIIVSAAMFNLHRENKLKRSGQRDYLVEGKAEQETQDLGHTHPGFYYTV